MDSFPNTAAACRRGMAALVLLACLILAAACTGKKPMAIEEAKAVSLAISRSETIQPPPRRVIDILTLLNQPGVFDTAISERLRSQSDALPPETTEPKTRIRFYLDRGRAALEMGRGKQALADLRTGKEIATAAGVKSPELLFRLGVAEASFGNIRTGIEYIEKSQAIQPTTRNFQKLVSLYLKIGDFDTASRLARQGADMVAAVVAKKRRKGKPFQHNLGHDALMRADILEAQGKFKQAEPLRRRHLDIQTQNMAIHPRGVMGSRFSLAGNLRKQNRLVEAEKEIRLALTQAIGHGGQEADFTARAVLAMGAIVLDQGRNNEAISLGRAALNILLGAGIEGHAATVVKTRAFLIKALVELGDFPEAVRVYDQASADLVGNPYAETTLAATPQVMLALLETGRPRDAMVRISQSLGSLQNRLPPTHPAVARFMGLRAMAHERLGDSPSAQTDFAACAPILTAASHRRNNRVDRTILENYMSLLGSIPMGTGPLADPIIEAFRIAETLRGGRVQEALSAATARESGMDPELSDLARKEQDLLQRQQTTEALLLDILAMPKTETDPAAMAALEEQLGTIDRARTAIVNEIHGRFPKYADLQDPRPASPVEIRKRLGPDEALIAIYTGVKHTWVWAIAPGRDTAFAMIPLGRNQIGTAVAALRQALDLQVLSLGEIPAFDLATAHRLFKDLLDPVRKGWENARELIVVADGPLGTIPLGLLVTEKTTPKEKRLLFDAYRSVPWLLRKVAISRLPSATALISLRSGSPRPPARSSFVGFGDPFFNRRQLADAVSNSREETNRPERKETAVAIRGVRVTSSGSLDGSQSPASGKLSMLNRLPDTSKELVRIANALDADAKRDVFLGTDASESTVKTMILSDRRVIAFATHALVPGDLDGLTQPALALSAPEVTGTDEDGLLTLSEVLALKLNADWVILSACNTGSADGTGVEAISGLGRAFFYAGARALLITMWSVETTSARELTTGLFQALAGQKHLSRSEALRRSILALMDGPGMTDPESGTVAASYAHPFFWAPFVLAGENGTGRLIMDH